MYILLLCLQDKDTCASMTLDSWMVEQLPQHWIGVTFRYDCYDTSSGSSIFDPRTLHMNLTSTTGKNAMMLKRQNAYYKKNNHICMLDSMPAKKF